MKTYENRKIIKCYLYRLSFRSLTSKDLLDQAQCKWNSKKSRDRRKSCFVQHFRFQLCRVQLICSRWNVTPQQWRNASNMKDVFLECFARLVIDDVCFPTLPRTFRQWFVIFGAGISWCRKIPIFLLMFRSKCEIFRPWVAPRIKQTNSSIVCFRLLTHENV